MYYNICKRLSELCCNVHVPVVDSSFHVVDHTLPFADSITPEADAVAVQSALTAHENHLGETKTN